VYLNYRFASQLFSFYNFVISQLIFFTRDFLTIFNMSKNNLPLKTAKLVTIILFLYCHQSYAQNNDKEAYKKFAIEAGGNISNMNFNKGVPAPPSHIQSAWNAGVLVGVVLQVPLAQNLFLKPGYYYLRRNGEDKSIQTKYANDYFSLPILLKYKLSSLLDVLAGPQVELLIHSNSYNNSIKTNITHDVEERSIAATAGFDVHLIQSFYLSARYLLGFNHVGIGQRSNPKEFKYEAASLAVGFEF
jgi:hypothetical protein